jgi:hypothetical protein
LYRLIRCYSYGKVVCSIKISYKTQIKQNRIKMSKILLHLFQLLLLSSVFLFYKFLAVPQYILYIEQDIYCIVKIVSPPPPQIKKDQIYFLRKIPSSLHHRRSPQVQQRWLNVC